MASTRVFRILALALILALLASALPATPALGAGNLDLTPTEGKIGDSIEAYGYDFNTTSEHDLYFAKEEASVGKRIGTEVTTYKLVLDGIIYTDDRGIFQYYTFIVPAKLTDKNGDDVTVRNGTYWVYITLGNQKDILGREQFTVKSLGSSTLTPVEGIVGTEVNITGQGFDASEDITVKYDGVNVAIKSGDKKTDSAGKFTTTTIVIPSSTAGKHTITATGSASALVVETTFTVQPKMTVNRESGAAGSTVTASGTGFGSSSDVSIIFGADEVTTGRTSSTGGFELTFKVPNLKAGISDVKAVDKVGNSYKVTFTIAASAINIRPTSGSTGIEVTISGTGFQAGKSVTITLGDESVKNATASDSGNFSTSFIVPVRTPGTYKIKASDGTNTLETDFSITSSVSIIPATSAASPGHIGMQLTISGDGFAAGRTVTITYDGNQVTTTPVNANGTFSATFKAPAGKGGTHSITATDGVNTKPFTFIMESSPPPIPRPLIPEMGIKAKAQTYFDWEDVTDPSGVTYTLQIATDAAFTTIALEKKGLTTSEYTLTKEERLKSAGKESPYYWHVKAVDGASNESQWTGKGEFYVAGFSLALSKPIIYTLIGVGVLLLILFGFWIGRKTAYY